MEDEQKKNRSRRIFIQEVVRRLRKDFTAEEVKHVWHLINSNGKIKTESQEIKNVVPQYLRVKQQYDTECKRFREIELKYKKKEYTNFSELKQRNWKKDHQYETDASQWKNTSPQDNNYCELLTASRQMFQMDQNMRNNYKNIEKRLVRLNDTKYVNNNTNSHKNIFPYQLKKKGEYIRTKKNSDSKQNIYRSQSPCTDATVPKKYLDRIRSRIPKQELFQNIMIE